MQVTRGVHRTNQQRNSGTYSTVIEGTAKKKKIIKSWFLTVRNDYKKTSEHENQGSKSNKKQLGNLSRSLRTVLPHVSAWTMDGFLAEVALLSVVHLLAEMARNFEHGGFELLLISR